MKYIASNPTQQNVYFPLSKRTLIAGESNITVEYNGDVANLTALGLDVEPVAGAESVENPEPETSGKNKRGKR